jgi:hypothetical protein
MTDEPITISTQYNMPCGRRIRSTRLDSRLERAWELVATDALAAAQSSVAETHTTDLPPSTHILFASRLTNTLVHSWLSCIDWGQRTVVVTIPSLQNLKTLAGVIVSTVLSPEELRKSMFIAITSHDSVDAVISDIIARARSDLDAGGLIGAFVTTAWNGGNVLRTQASTFHSAAYDICVSARSSRE